MNLFTQINFIVSSLFCFLVGLRKRTRRIVQSATPPHGKCPPHLLETGLVWKPLHLTIFMNILFRPCLAPACYQFQWMVRDGDVFCQRSDGLPVKSKWNLENKITWSNLKLKVQWNFFLYASPALLGMDQIVGQSPISHVKQVTVLASLDLPQFLPPPMCGPTNFNASLLGQCYKS